MAIFRPYKNIKELYNPERLVMPAIRDQILNSIFLGKSSEKGETLLDNQNYPYFDLWVYCINHYRYSVYETIRGELVVTPDTMSCLPPFPNVIFPNEYVHYGRTIKLRDFVTRYVDQGFHTTPSLENADGISASIEMAQEAFIGPDSSVEPLIADVIRAECTPKDLSGMETKTIKEDGEDNGGFKAFLHVPLPEEFHYGSNIRTGEGEYLLRAGESLARKNFGSSINEGSELDGESSINLVDEYNNYHKLNVLYKFFLSRLQSQKTPQVRLTFTPRLIPGLPVLLIVRNGQHSFGLITSMSHVIDAQGVAETHLTVEYQYLYDDATKRPLYFYRDKRIEQKLLNEQSSAAGDENAYVWKNYFMLSDNFRDKNIGSEIYKKVLFDGISNTDYNPFSYKLKGMKDKSILGIHSVFKDIPKVTNKSEKKV